MTTDAEIRAKLQPRSVLALTLWAEASGESVETRVAIGAVIRNRRKMPSMYRAADDGYDAICLAPSQFSCWNGGDANYARLMGQAERVAHALAVTDVVLHECFWIADGIMDGILLDRSYNSCWYLEQNLYQKDPPRWAKMLTVSVVIKPFVFLRTADRRAIT